MGNKGNRKENQFNYVKRWNYLIEDFKLFILQGLFFGRKRLFYKIKKINSKIHIINKHIKINIKPLKTKKKLLLNYYKN